MVQRFVWISTWHSNLRGAGVCQGGECPQPLNEALRMHTTGWKLSIKVNTFSMILSCSF